MKIFETIRKHAGKYFFGSFFSALITLLMMKYYTKIFTPKEFGVLALFLIILEYVKAFVSLNMYQSITRLYFDYKGNSRDEYLSTIFWFIFILASIVVLISIIILPYLSFLIAPNSELIFIVTIFAGIFSVCVNFLLRVLINEEQSSSVMKHNIFQTILNHLSSFIFISFFHLGILGRISGQTVSSFTNLIALLKEFSYKKLFKLKFIFNKQMAKETFVLSIPMIFLYLQNVLFLYLDRIFLKYYIGDSAVGIYSLGYMLGQGLSLVYDAITQAILPKFYQQMQNDYKSAISELEHFALKYYVGLILLTIVISVLSPIIVELISNKNYTTSSTVLPYVMVGFMMGGMYKVPSLVLGFHKIVWFYPFLGFVSFGMNALLNWLLIPTYGVVGAAFASFMGLFIYSSYMQYINRKYMKSTYNKIVIYIYMVIFIFVIGIFLK